MNKFEGHTPGPWKWEGSRPVDEETMQDPDFPEHITANGKVVLRSWDYEGYSSGVYVREADQRLIAAAPELLRQRDLLMTACVEAAHFLMCKARRDPQERDVVSNLNEAISEVEQSIAEYDKEADNEPR